MVEWGCMHHASAGKPWGQLGGTSGHSGWPEVGRATDWELTLHRECLATGTNWLVFFFPYREEQNILEAASNGASASVGLVANIAANLIAFLAVLEFINAALRWFGEMVDIEGLSFQVSPRCSPIIWATRSYIPHPSLPLPQ